MTDLVKRATPRADELTTAEYRAGLERVARLCAWLRPGAVCFVGLAGWRAAVDRKAVAGVQPEPLGDTPVYVMPSTSGLNARTTPAELADHLRAAAALADRVLTLPPDPNRHRGRRTPSGRMATGSVVRRQTGRRRRRRVAATTSEAADHEDRAEADEQAGLEAGDRQGAGGVGAPASAESVAGAVEVVVGAAVVVVVTAASTCTESDASLAGAAVVAVDRGHGERVRLLAERRRAGHRPATGRRRRPTSTRLAGRPELGDDR